MKKYYFGLAFLGLLLGYNAKMEYWFHDERDVFFPITKEQLRAKKQLQKNQAQTNDTADEATPATDNSGAPTTSTTNEAVNLEKLSQSELFNQLYNRKVLNEKANHPTYFQMISTRLKSIYPANDGSEFRSGYEFEVANRIGIMRAMAQFWPTPKQLDGVEQKPVKQLFYDIARNKNENLMVRRQAFKNWLNFGNTVSQSEKMKLASTGDSRLLHLVSLSDETLIESLTTGDE